MSYFIYLSELYIGMFPDAGLYIAVLEQQPLFSAGCVVVSRI